MEACVTFMFVKTSLSIFMLDFHEHSRNNAFKTSVLLVKSSLRLFLLDFNNPSDI